MLSGSANRPMQPMARQRPNRCQERDVGEAERGDRQPTRGRFAVRESKLVCAQLGIASRLVRQEDATRVLEVPPRGNFATRLVGTPKTAGWRAWNDRAVALAAAMTVQREGERDR